MYTVPWLRVFLTWLRFFFTLTKVFPCFILSCKANFRVKLLKTGHGPHFSKLVVICFVRLFVLFNVLFVCKCVLLPGDNTIAVNKYHIISYHIISYHTSYHISYHISYIISYIISYRNIGSRSRNHCCRKKAVIISYSECAFVTLFIQHAKLMHRIILPSVACLAIP
jgi:hypothetical protein